jgi:hypothetical protein
VPLSDLRSMKDQTQSGVIGPGRLGHVTGVVPIRRWIGDGILFISERPHQIVAQPDPLAAPLDRNRKDYGKGRVSSSSILQS